MAAPPASPPDPPPEGAPGPWARAHGLVTSGARALGLDLPAGLEAPLRRYVDELLLWNRKVNLTAVTDLDELAERHLLDSLAVLPEVAPHASLLDLGSGAGLPGIPLALALPHLEATLVDAVGKKVGFLKSALVKVGLTPRVRAVHAHARGSPAAEGLPLVDAVVARAFTEVGALVPLALPYLRPGGAVVALLGVPPPVAQLEALAAAHGTRLQHLRPYALPHSQARRAVAVFRTLR